MKNLSVKTKSSLLSQATFENMIKYMENMILLYQFSSNGI